MSMIPSSGVDIRDTVLEVLPDPACRISTEGGLDGNPPTKNDEPSSGAPLILEAAKKKLASIVLETPHPCTDHESDAMMTAAFVLIYDPRLASHRKALNDHLTNLQAQRRGQKSPEVTQSRMENRVGQSQSPTRKSSSRRRSLNHH